MKHIFAALALSVAQIVSVAAPASAGGQFTFSVQANNERDAHAIRTGLVMYRMVKDIRSNGHISQEGFNNAAALAQGGRGNIGVIHQEGRNHRASLRQNGGYNSCGIFQFGHSGNAHVVQGGGQACLVFQGGF